MASLPTYEQIGITAAWIVTICRILQGLSSMGEVMGAKIYITEITKPPAQYPAVLLVTLSSSLGAMVALGLASLVTHISMNWRVGFWIGACIAVVGSVARTRLRETPDFVDMKRKKQLEIERNRASEKRKMELLEGVREEVSRSKINKKDFLAYFLLECSNPLCFYLYYI
jgi:MFS family permease